MTGARGVYVSSLSTSDWEADPDLPPPAQMHVLCAADGVEGVSDRLDRVEGVDAPGGLRRVGLDAFAERRAHVRADRLQRAGPLDTELGEERVQRVGVFAGTLVCSHRRTHSSSGCNLPA